MSGVKNPLIQQLIQLIDAKNDVVSEEFKTKIRKLKPKQHSMLDTDAWDGPSLLTTVAKKSLPQHLDYLLHCDVALDVNRVDGNGNSALHCCCNVCCVELLLAAKADPNIRSDSSLTPLHVYADQDLIECAKTLIEAGAEVNAQTRYFGLAPLHQVRSAAMVCLLCSVGANVDVRNSNQETPLIRCINHSRAAEIVDALLQAGADVKAVDRFGNDALCTLCQKYLTGNAKTRARNVAPLLILAGAPLDARTQTNKHTRQPIECVYDSPWLLRLLLVAGAEPTKSDVEKLLDHFSGAPLIVRAQVFLPIVFAKPSMLSLIEHHDLKEMYALKDWMAREKTQFDNETIFWHQTVWKHCHARVLELALIFSKLFPTLVVAELCFAEQSFLRQIKYHLITNCIESVRKFNDIK